LLHYAEDVAEIANARLAAEGFEENTDLPLFDVPAKELNL
jgi:hypothetical protein